MTDALRVGGRAEAESAWVLRYTDFAAADEGTREALCTLANGYWGTRGAGEDSDADGVHYPGTYFAGVYDTVLRRIQGRSVADEEMVNAPNWLPLRFRMAGGQWFRVDSAELVDYCQELDLKTGVLTRTMTARGPEGRLTRITAVRLVSLASPRLAAMRFTIEAVNWAGAVTINSAIDGRVTNTNVPDHTAKPRTHLFVRKRRQLSADSILLETETRSSGIHLSVAARTTVQRGEEKVEPERLYLTDRRGVVAHEFTVDVEAGVPLTVEKVVSVSTSRDRAILSPSEAAATQLRRAPGFDAIRAAHEAAWSALWDEFAIDVKPERAQSLAVNLNTFHVLQTVSSVVSDLDAGIPARGLHGEGYDGHVFWDELFVYPVLTLRRPDLSRALLGYRHRRLGEARAAAAAVGRPGAMFPWQSGIDGSDVTPRQLFNPMTATWMPDNSQLQRHVGLAVAYSTWQFYESTGDLRFLLTEGAAMIVEVARFFASLAVYDEARDRYSIRNVMGPDEFHDGYPGSPGSGVNDNVYTNVMTAWVLRRAIDTVELLAECPDTWAWRQLGADDAETSRWAHIAARLTIVFNADGTLSQFEGYDRLERLDLDLYRQRYGSIGRLDLILNAEGDTTNRYQVSKQPDSLMLLYLFSAEELRDLFEAMGYSLPPEVIVATVERYSATSTYGSTLSNVVHSWLEARRDRTRSWDFLVRALQSDVSDIQGGTTRHGIHVAAMAGSVDMLTRCYTGLEMRAGLLWFHPQLPPEIESAEFSLTYREHVVRVSVSPTLLTLRSRPGSAAPIGIVVNDQHESLATGETRSFHLG